MFTLQWRLTASLIWFSKLVMWRQSKLLTGQHFELLPNLLYKENEAFLTVNAFSATVTDSQFDPVSMNC